MAGSKRVEPWQTPEWRSHCAAERQKFRDGLFYQLMAPVGRGAAKKASAKRAAPPAKKLPARAAKKPYDPKYSEKRGALG